MTIRYRTSGDDFAARGLLGEGRHQLSILKNKMTFQGLKQLQQVTRFNDGTVIKCLSCFDQDVVEVFVPPGEVAEEKKIVSVDYCWCSHWFTEGKIVEIYHEYSNVGEYSPGEYPENCNETDQSIENYIGIRYLVNCCQGSLQLDNEVNKVADYSQFICLPSDFAEYKEGDRVIVFMRGRWDKNILEEPDRVPGRSCLSDEYGECWACRGTRRKKEDSQDNTEADGSYLIMPLEIAGVNLKDNGI